MSERKVWLITGAGRGMGVEIAKAALAAGNAVVATGRDTDTVAEAVGEADNLLVVKVDVTSRADAESAMATFRRLSETQKEREDKELREVVKRLSDVRF